MTLSKIKNPDYVNQFKEFVIKIFDSDYNLIAQSSADSFSQYYSTT